MLILSSFLSFFYFLSSINAQSISASTPLPPLQWINLSPLLQASNAPPALRDAAIAYDDTSRSLIVFGGESQSGFPQSQTYLLNLDSLVWSTPNPPAGLTQAPPARSAAIAGLDIAASYRRGFVIVGGKGANAQALSDVWEFDFNSQFWSQVSVSPGSPSPRWGASGGIDTRTSPVQDPRMSYPNNTFYLAGGVSSSQSNSLSDIWRLNISGTLAANLQSSVGSWDHLTVGNMPAKVGQGGTVVSNQIVSVGGCNSSTGNSSVCAQQDSYIVAVGGSDNLISPNSCLAPRYGPALVPNMNTYSSSFSSQVFVLSGIYNSSLWDVGGSTNDGEIDVLDINGGTWVRVLPAGDPASTGQGSYPVARQGAAVVAYQNALVGQNRKTASDIILFGGQDASGRYLSDLWLLRSYNGSVTPSNPKWPGYGDGQLQTGVNADGSGVLMKFPNKCATRITASSSPSSSGTSSLPTGTSPASSDTSLGYNTTIIHKILAPLSVALLLPISFYFRLTLSTYTDKKVSESQLSWFLAVATITFLAYAMGIVGLVASFAFLSTSLSNAPTTLPTTHSRVGLAFFACLYVIIPALFVLRYFIARSAFFEDNGSTGTERRANSLDTAEKLGSLPGHAGSTVHSSGNSPPSSPLIHSHSLGHVRNRTTEAVMSSDTESITSAGQQRGFEVLNRPPKNRHANNSSWAQVYVESSQPLNPRSLSDVDWLLRRRSLNAVDELDYAITQFHNARQETPATIDRLINTRTSQNTIKCPSFFDSLIHILLQASLLGISVVSLYTLLSRRYYAWFVVLLTWTVLYYVVIFAFSWFGRPEKSVLSVTISRLRGTAMISMPPDNQELTSQHDNAAPQDGPYLHQPPYRAATREELSQARPISLTTDDDDDHIDEDTRQRMIEEEMERRDVSIVTVPRRRLLVANPS